MKLFKPLSFIALTALAASACSSLMAPNSSPAPVDTMNVNVGQAVQTSTTTASTPGTTVSPSSSTRVGGSLSGSVGKSMDDSDNAKVNQVLETQKTGQTSTWTNSSSAISYTLTPTRTFTSPTGEPCRDFTESALINGQTQQIYGTACRDQNAQWHVISS